MDPLLLDLGSNFLKLPIKPPLSKPVTPTERDGESVYDDNMDGSPNYFPNSYSNAKTDQNFNEHSFRATSIPDVDRYDSTNEDNYSQVCVFIYFS
ncbi:catalase-like protein [Leptotrombidium deliense]|uniref:Catalase-like protein n=1 Tax=Leptotrombidium deliense TaxID=299467 RepID=A0A443RX75_9ACAR|nr:catalase-like protein [Leptotrombidium deliense]